MAEINQKRRWKMEDGITREIEYLRQMNDFHIFERNGRNYFSVSTHNGVKEYSSDAIIMFHDIREDENGDIKSLKYRIFNPIIMWQGEDGTDNELIEYLLKNHILIIDPDNFDEMYKIRTANGSYFSYPIETQIRFFNIKRDSGDKIESLDFRVVVNKKKAVMADDNEAEEIKWLKKAYGFLYDDDAREYRLRIGDEVKHYPEGIRFLFHSREYDKEGKLCAAGFFPQILKWSTFSD